MPARTSGFRSSARPPTSVCRKCGEITPRRAGRGGFSSRPRESRVTLIAANHYRCSPGVEKLLGYFLLLEEGSQTMLTPAEFEQRFGWKNAPSQVPQLPGTE
mgnify:CR=1 FL=1